MSKHQTIEGVLVVGGISIPATVKVSVELDLTGSDILSEVFVEDSTEEDRDDAIEDDGEAAPAAPETVEVPAKSRVEKVREAIAHLRSITEYNAPSSVLSNVPAGYGFADADRARARILSVVEANLTDGTIDSYADNVGSFLSRVNATWGGDKVVAEYIHSTLVAAARS